MNPQRLLVGTKISVAKLYKFRPSDSFSPRRELQEFIQGLGSSNSLRQSRLRLSETQSRSGENGSPKRVPMKPGEKF
ncbi:hypothetical protein DEO72_LG8g2585 [Vigna unguiculata]|uniref:Uncharacterized protein n=1 Tax=Vigna unguiculata TaxID=3917 RepID=A0A4D6MWP0_VIGUN|nr:hypothetical protein DEO72_LG8g2585 [Vigna unguiculata]